MKYAFVTGANKGIGYAIVNNLSKRFPDWTIYLTSRDTGRGQEALEKLKTAGCANVKFHQLDIDDPTSRAQFVEFAKKEVGSDGIQIFINNAAIAYKRDSQAPMSEQARVTCQTDYFSTMEMVKAVLPLMGKDSNMVNVSSICSFYALKNTSDELYARIMGLSTIDEVDAAINEFIKLAQTDAHKAAGWPDMAYGVAKMGLTKATQIIGQQLKTDPRNVIISSCCPGYVDTDMSSHKGPLTIDQGALTPVFCATERSAELQGSFVNDRKIADWSKGSSIELVKSIE